MPILQSRLLRVVEAAGAFASFREQIQSLVATEAIAVREGHQSWQDAYNTLALHIGHFQPAIANAEKILELERQHYRLTHKRNERNALRLATRRRFHSHSFPEGTFISEAGMPRSAAEVAAQLEWEEGDLDDISIEGHEEAVTQSADKTKTASKRTVVAGIDISRIDGDNYSNISPEDRRRIQAEVDQALKDNGQS